MLKTVVYSSIILSSLVVACLSAFGHGDKLTLLEDVNNDGVVNILDLVRVANAFGQPVDRDSDQNPDVNRDGAVNVLDLVRVANRFGETAGIDNSTYHDIQDYIFNRSCTASYCHAAPTNAGNLNLTSGVSYQDLAGRVPQNLAAESAGMKRVDPGNPDNSFLLTKLVGPSTPAEGARMPLGAGPLHSGKIDAIRKWIAAGASRNEKLTDIGDLSLLRDPLESFEPLQAPL
ncbi:MAG: dockerin type I domain-containing protein, partial [Candidatus Poribacteria bacterium]|nr:dockerin type I domain-containing protein [Candidatus Poribacteria bacterium]